MNSVYFCRNGQLYLAEIVGDDELTHLEFTHQGLFLICLTASLNILVLDRAGTSHLAT
jgi:hypothetical protein